jgi:hypothetical protein
VASGGDEEVWLQLVLEVERLVDVIELDRRVQTLDALRAHATRAEGCKDLSLDAGLANVWRAGELARDDAQPRSRRYEVGPPGCLADLERAQHVEHVGAEESLAVDVVRLLGLTEHDVAAPVDRDVRPPSLDQSARSTCSSSANARRTAFIAVAGTFCPSGAVLLARSQAIVRKAMRSL